MPSAPICVKLISGGLCTSKAVCMKHTDFELGKQTELHMYTNAS